MDFIFFILLLLLFVAAVILFFGKLAGKLTSILVRGKPGLEKWEARVSNVTYLVFTNLFFYFVYTAIFPTDSFYFDEFTEVTLRQPPKSASVINKWATYPDFHGDYCSYSKMELSSEDYSELLIELSNDSRLKRENIWNDRTEEKSFYSEKSAFTRTIQGQEDHHLQINFLTTGQHIEVNICVT